VTRRIELTRAAVKDLDRLPASSRDQVLADIRTLESNPLGSPPRVKRLRGFGVPLHRLRSGDHRVIYRLDADLVMVMRIIDRGDLERQLRRLRRT
jgi:mRNA-degrading endonuclease RelE of RelBE toxin-antitoxin system